MQFNVPQFIDVEDKIVGPLTAKQLGWIAVGGVLFLIFWGTLDTATFIFAAIIDAAVFGALAFYKPYNQPLIKFIMSSFHFVSKPKVYVWKRDYDSMGTMKKKTVGKKEEPIIKKKTLNEERIREISKMLDENH